MEDNPKRLSQFCQELKRRKVVRVITVYAAAAFVIIELVDILAPNLGLPPWTFNFVLILLLVGFVLSIIVSWIYDIHPEEGIVKTKAVPAGKTGETAQRSNAWKIATYISVMLIIGLIAFNIWGGKGGARIDESLVRSIAVLPFHNFSGDEDQNPMCLGLTDEIISHLYKVESFDEVRSLTSVLPYLNSEMSTPEIAGTLRVNFILEGTYKRIGDELRVTAQLIDTKSDKHIWTRDYDLPYHEVIGIPAEIAFQIADHLKAFISKDEKQSISRIPSENLEAYELMQEAIYLFNTVFLNAAEEIIGLCEEVIRLDPGYADAYATKGLLMLANANYFGGEEMRSVAWEAETYFEKAISLDDRNVRAITGMASIDHFLRWDYVKAEGEYMKALAYKQGETVLNGWLVLFLMHMNRLNDALDLLDKSGFQWITAQAQILFLSGDHRKAYDLIRENLVFGSYHSDEITPCLELYVWLEDYNAALELYESATQSNDSYIQTPAFQANLAVAYHKTGEVAQAEAIVNRLIRRSDTSSVGSPEFFLGTYYSWTGAPDSAFHWLEKAFQNRSIELPLLKVHPAFNALKDDPRYRDLYERTGHKAYEEYLASKDI